jgi:hypothetical protein
VCYDLEVVIVSPSARASGLFVAFYIRFLFAYLRFRLNPTSRRADP